jgi:hypothetical protein
MNECLPEAERNVDTLLSEILMWVICNRDLMEAGRQHLEDTLIELRDGGIGIMGRGNGFTVNDKDGTPSPIMRLGTPEGIRIALEAMARSLAGN